MENITTEEKIDYIFKTLHKQERRHLFNTISKRLFRLFLIWYMVYFYLYWFELLIDRVNETIKENLNMSISTENFDSAKNSIINAIKGSGWSETLNINN
jgi:hypothetical protein